MIKLNKINDKELSKIVGGRLRSARSHSGLSQTDLQNTTGIDRATLSRIENGNQRISLYQFLQVINALNVDLNFILDGIEVDNEN